MEQLFLSMMVQYSVRCAGNNYRVVSYEILYKYEVLLLIFSKCRRFKKGAVFSGIAIFVLCGTINSLSDAQTIIIGRSAMKFCASMG